MRRIDDITDRTIVGNTLFALESAVLKALAWSEYLESHAKRLYASIIMPEVSAAKAIISKIRTKALVTPFVNWHVWKQGWAGLSDRKVVAEALQLLVDYQWLFVNRKDTGGRPSDEYTLNSEVSNEISSGIEK